MAPYGRARRLVENLEAVAGADVRDEIMDGLVEPTAGSSPKRKARWAREVIARMDGRLEPSQCREIRERCACTPAKKHVAEARRTWRETGNLPDYVQTTNEAGWHGKWDVGDGFSAIMTDALQNSGRFIVLGDKDMRGEAMAEQDLVAGGRTARGAKAAKMGRMTPAQLLVRGSITHVQSSTTGGRGGLSFKGIRVGGSGDKAEVNVTIYLVDSETGQV